MPGLFTWIAVSLLDLLDLNIGALDDLAPFRGLDLDHRREFRGRIADRFGAKAGKLFLHIDLRQRSGDFGAEPGDDVVRRAGRGAIVKFGVWRGDQAATCVG